MINNKVSEKNVINFSVIIPHKNIPILLQRCLDSIPCRNDIQVIIIDDNSDPNIVDFDNFPGKENPLVEIILTKEGKGAGYARNIGLLKAKGKWLLFADADDFFTNRINNVIDFYRDSDADLIYFKVLSKDSETLEDSTRDEFFNKLFDSDVVDILRYEHVVPWGKLIKKKLVDSNNISFDEVSFSNDVMFAVKTGHFAKKIDVSEEAFYCITSRKNSLFTTQTEEALFSRYEVQLRKNAFLYKMNKPNFRVKIFPFLKQIGKEFGVMSFIKASLLIQKYKKAINV